MHQSLTINWDASDFSIGEDRRGKRWLAAHGTATGNPALKSERVYLSAKTDGIYHLVFCPATDFGLSRDGKPIPDTKVIADGVDLGPMYGSRAPGREWGLDDKLVTQARAVLQPDNPFIQAVADAVGAELN